METALQAAESVDIPKTSVFLIDGEKPSEDGIQTIGCLLTHGIHQWERMNDNEALSQR